MKKLLVILALIPAMLFAQQTYVPDDNFEQALIDLGLDYPPLNDSVPTKNIDTLTYLNVFQRNIKDLKGIEDFGALTVLDCSANALTSLDVSKNTALTKLGCDRNSLTSLDVSNNTALIELGCSKNYLKILDVSSNTALTELECWNNGLTSLDVTKNTYLRVLYCLNNPDLYCIQVADTALEVNKTDWYKDEHAIYSEDCGYTSTEEDINTNTHSLSITPNPAKDYIEVSGVVGEVKLFDVLGNTVLSLGDSRFRGNDMKGVGNNTNYSSEKHRLDVSALPKGMYFVSVGGQMYKFVKM